jgi:hypothetical protein
MKAALSAFGIAQHLLTRTPPLWLEKSGTPKRRTSVSGSLPSKNIIVALLANAPDDRLELIREMADFISPRPGMTPHRLTIEAARNMLAIVERAEHYKDKSPQALADRLLSTHCGHGPDCS